MPNYVRLQGAGSTFFFTVALADRSQRILIDYLDVLRLSFAETKRALPFTVDAIVVLPEHLHCIWTLPPGSADFSSRWSSIKAGFSRRLQGGEHCSESRRARRERGIWQRRFWEHAIRDVQDYAAHVDYIHYNPVKHGHVVRPADWRASSFHRFVREGLLPPDWAQPEAGAASRGEPR